MARPTTRHPQNRRSAAPPPQVAAAAALPPAAPPHALPAPRPDMLRDAAQPETRPGPPAVRGEGGPCHLRSTSAHSGMGPGPAAADPCCRRQSTLCHGRRQRSVPCHSGGPSSGVYRPGAPLQRPYKAWCASRQPCPRRHGDLPQKGCQPTCPVHPPRTVLRR